MDDRALFPVLGRVSTRVRVVPRLTNDETLSFLSERGHLLRLATIDDDGMPRLAPVWFAHSVDDGQALGTIWFTPRERSVFFANLRRDPRLALSVDEDDQPNRKISVQGRARIVHDLGHDDEWRDRYREIACRFLDEGTADRYLGATRDQPRALLAVDLDDAKVTTWRMPLEGEDPTGIWAERFYADGSRMQKLADQD